MENWTRSVQRNIESEAENTMNNPWFVKSFRELEVYGKQQMLSAGVFSLTKEFPSEEKLSLTSQRRRAARSSVTDN